MGDNNSWGSPDYAAHALDEIKKLRKELLEIELQKAQMLALDPVVRQIETNAFISSLKRKLEGL